MLPRLALLALLMASLTPSPALAADGATDLVSTTRDFVPTTRDLVLPVEDLVLTVQDMIKVTQVAKETTIEELPADVLFDFDKADIRPDAAVALAAAADLLRKGVTGTVKVEGHTDAKGTAPYNLKLSQDRANAVKTWLVQKEGLAKVAFAITGYGATRPAAPNTNPDGSDSPAGRQLNRRVVITFTAK